MTLKSAGRVLASILVVLVVAASAASAATATAATVGASDAVRPDAQISVSSTQVMSSSAQEALIAVPALSLNAATSGDEDWLNRAVTDVREAVPASERLLRVVCISPAAGLASGYDWYWFDD